MIERLIDFCARNKFLVLLIVGLLTVAGIWAAKNAPLDAIPDLSDTQVIVYSRWDRSPDIIEDQVTYPIITAMLGAPRVKTIRGFSDFGFSYVYIIFEDGTDIYWARSRTLEYLSKILPRLPEGVKTELGPDATGIGWVFEYALVDETGQNDLAQLRSFQDWTLKYHLQSVPGVAEVATVGGFSKQYQVNVDPNALAAYNVPLMMVVEAIRKGNNEVGGRLVEWSGTEYMVRGRGYLKSIDDIQNIVVMNDPKTGTPVLIRQLGEVTLGPDIRRGVAELDGKGEVVGGVVVMRYGENALRIIERVKARLKELEASLPPGVKVVTTYDRSELILESIDTLKHELRQEIIIVSLIILLFLWHIPSALIPIFTLPIAVIIAFIPMYFMHITVNIMSLGGIAVSIGAMVDAAIVVVENAHKKLEKWEAEGKKGDPNEILIMAIKEVGRASFFSLLVIAVSFIPVFALEAQEGRLFKPLAFTKNFSMALAAILAITLDPALRLLFTRTKNYDFKPRWAAGIANAVLVGKMHSEEKHPISRFLFRIYDPVVAWVLKNRGKTIVAAVTLVIITLIPFARLGSEFMPPLDEGDLLYMPTTLPGISVTEATRWLQTQDKILKTFPEVERVFGKIGRAETSTDPAPFSMVETTVLLKPKSEWRKVSRWYSWMLPPFRSLFATIWPETMTTEELVNQMDRRMQLPGTTNAWTMPIKNRTDMLTTGIRTPIGIKIFGADLNVIENIGEKIEAALRDVPGTRSLYAERVSGGYFLDFEIKRHELARYGLSVDDAQMIIMSAIGGENITTTIEKRERYPVNVRYAREFRDDINKLERVLVATPSGAQIPLIQIADIKLNTGPSMIRDENGLLSGYVYIDVAGRDIGGYVADAKKAVEKSIQLPTGYALTWSGQYEAMERVREKLIVVLPVTLVIIIFLIYLNTQSWVKTAIVLLAVPFSAIGAIWLLWALGYNMSVAVWVGMIALMGLDAETGIFMLLYLDLAVKERVEKGLMRTRDDLHAAIHDGAVRRIRPKFMTVAASFMGLLPIMWSHGAGADVMKRIAAPMVGGLFTSFLLELIVYPAIYSIWHWEFGMKREERKKRTAN